MLYVKEIIDHKIGDRTPFKKVADQMGWTLTIDESETEKAYDGSLWEKGYAPKKPTPTHEEIEQIRRQLYIAQVDPITAHINRLKDEEKTEEILAEIEALKIERAEIVAKIKEENPYPTEE